MPDSHQMPPPAPRPTTMKRAAPPPPPPPPHARTRSPSSCPPRLPASDSASALESLAAASSARTRSSAARCALSCASSVALDDRISRSDSADLPPASRILLRVAVYWCTHGVGVCVCLRCRSRVDGRCRAPQQPPAPHKALSLLELLLEQRALLLEALVVGARRREVAL